MPGSKAELIAILKDIAVLMNLNADNHFRARAYENAARALEPIEGQPEDWIARNTLAKVAGVGKGITGIVREYAETGKVGMHETLRAEAPPGIAELIRVPGLGIKKIQMLWRDLSIGSVEALEEAARAGALRGVPGFGPKSAEKILEGIEQLRQSSGRQLISTGWRTADDLVEQMRKVPAVARIEVAGSLRRMRESIKDIDLIAETHAPEEVMEAFVALPLVDKVVLRGPTKTSVLLFNGMAVDLRVVSAGQFACALQYFTGSKEHNTRLRRRARRMGLLLNEYGLTHQEEKGEGKSLPCSSEEEIYRHLKLEFIEPEMREDRGEIDAAEERKLPKLITLDDFRGLLHCHSTYSDGLVPLRGMAHEAKERGYAYFGICDHSQAAAYAGGLKEADVLRQHEEIDAINSEMKGFRVLKGIESDILKDGRLDYSDDFLDHFEFVVASVHNRFALGREAMTDRVCRALEHPATRILGHPSGRLLSGGGSAGRPPFEIDYERVFETAAKHDVAIEINASPRRLDLDWTLVRQAKAAGCRFSINPDAHSVAEIDYMRYGVGMARKGWLEAGDVVNTFTQKKFLDWAARKSVKPRGKDKH